MILWRSEKICETEEELSLEDGDDTAWSYERDENELIKSVHYVGEYQLLLETIFVA